MADQDAAQEEVFGALVDWIVQNGGKVQHAQMKLTQHGERGVFLTNKVKAHTTVLELPGKCMLSATYARESSDVAKKLWISNPGFREPELIALVVHLLATRDDKDNFFRPYYDTLPKSVGNFPVMWNEEQIGWLKGSTAVDIVNSRKERLKKDFVSLTQLLPDFFKDITFTEFLEVRSIVGSRHVFFPQASLTAMVPFTDMLNHAVPSQIEHMYNPKLQRFMMNTGVKGPEGMELCSSYGAFSNTHYFVLYGFVQDDNRLYNPRTKQNIPLNTITNIQLKYDDDDPLRVKRMGVLEKCIVKLMKFKKKRQSVLYFSDGKDAHMADQEMSGAPGEKNHKDFKYYALAAYYNRKGREDPVKEVLNFFRVKVATENELDRLYDEMPDFNPNNSRHIEPSIFIGPHNEAEALEALAAFCAESLRQYPESYKTNLERLKDPAYTKDPLRKMALKVVTDEQSIYNLWREVAEICSPILRKYSMDPTDRLMAALTALPQDTPFEKDLHNVSYELALNLGDNSKK